MEEKKLDSMGQAGAGENKGQANPAAGESDFAKMLRARNEEIKKKNKEAQEAMIQGKGRLKLEKPILAMDEEVCELKYDFTEITGLEYANAMDSETAAMQPYRITYRQALALFAQAAAKQTEGMDMRDIIERIGITDAVEGVQLAMLFFSASTRAGHLRISKR